MYVWRRLVGKRSQSVRRSETHRQSDTGNLKENWKWELKEDWQSRLLPGEKVVTQASKIIRIDPFSCSDEDQIGELIVTNFRMIFSRYAEKDKEIDRKISQRNKLIESSDIALYSIDALYSVKKKKKKLIQDGIIPRHVKVVEIHCKDFRVHVFQFKLLNEKNEAFLVLNAILSGAFPQQLHSFFAFQYKGEVGGGDDVPRFNSEQDWKELLEQKGALGAFKVAQCNREFRVSDSLPECFVVPSSLSESVIVNKVKMFSNNRCPVWSYTHSNGASLVRMAAAMPGVGEELENEMVGHISRSHRKEKQVGCVVVDMNGRFPSLSEIQSSSEAIRNLSVSGSLKEFWLSDASWFSTIESSHWLSYVSCCLTVANEVAMNIINERTVVLKEIDGVDFTPLVSCLSQFIVDASVRTVDGFQRLIEREWVALGHKFAERCGNTRRAKTDVKSAIFLLFLDCTWQIVRQYPSQIQFTEYFLVSIWDSACLGIFRNFLFDSIRSSNFSPKILLQDCYISSLNPPTLLSVWDWEKQLSDDHIALFYSPQYVFLHENALKDQLDNISLQRADLSSSGDSKNEKPSARKDVLLIPNVEMPCLQLWSLCYLRWLPVAEVIGGGPASEYLSQCILVEESLYLCQMIEMELVDVKRSQNRRSSRLIFGSDSNRSLVRNSCSVCVSSSFPFSIDRPSDARFGPGSYIDSYFKNSVLYEGSPTSDDLDD